MMHDQIRKTDNGIVLTSDVPLHFLDLKRMDSGEVRLRFKTDGGDVVVRTQAPYRPEVQRGVHFYRGLTATYQVVVGWIAVVHCLCGSSDYRITYLESDSEPWVANPETQHTVLTGPLALFSTTKRGTAVSNHDRNGNDWWPAEPNFTHWAQSRRVDHVSEATGIRTSVLHLLPH